jgi:hypothetical protein
MTSKATSRDDEIVDNHFREMRRAFIKSWEDGEFHYSNAQENSPSKIFHYFERIMIPYLFEHPNLLQKKGQK